MRDRGRIVKVVIYGLIVVAVLIGGVLGRFIFSMLIESPYALLSNLLCVKSIALCPDNIVEVPMLLGWTAGSKESLMYQDLLGKDRVYVESEMRHRSTYNMIVAPSERYICYNLSANFSVGFCFMQDSVDTIITTYAEKVSAETIIEAFGYAFSDCQRVQDRIYTITTDMAVKKIMIYNPPKGTSAFLIRCYSG